MADSPRSRPTRSLSIHLKESASACPTSCRLKRLPNKTVLLALGVCEFTMPSRHRRSWLLERILARTREQAKPDQLAGRFPSRQMLTEACGNDPLSMEKNSSTLIDTIL